MADKLGTFLTAFHFSVTFMWDDKIVEIPFQTVSGIGGSIQTEDLEEGGENRFVHKLPKQVKFDNLKLSRALRSDDNLKQQRILIDWAEDALYNFNIKPKTVLVSILNELHLPVRSWYFVDAYPVKLSVKDLDAQRDELVIETLELTYKYSRAVSLDK